MIWITRTNRDAIRHLYWTWALQNWSVPPRPDQLTDTPEFMEYVLRTEVCAAGHGSTLEAVYAVCSIREPLTLSPELVQLVQATPFVDWDLSASPGRLAMVGRLSGRLRNLIDLRGLLRQRGWALLAEGIEAELLRVFPWLERKLLPPERWQPLTRPEQTAPRLEGKWASATYGNEPSVHLIDWVSDGECVDYVYFSLCNWSRALQQQLTRHRTGNFQFSSLRVMPMADFADMGLYHIPPAVSGEERDEYRQDMLVIQELYRKHLRPGRLPQEARGLLPLNIMSNGMFGMRFRDLMNFMGQRLCVMSQNEIRRFGALLRAELVRVFPFLDKKLHCPCFGDDGQQFKPCVFTPLPEAKVIS